MSCARADKERPSMDGWMDRVGGRKRTTSEDRGGLEVQVNDKMCVRQREVWFMLYSSSEKEKNNNNKREGPSPFLSLGIFPSFCGVLHLVSIHPSTYFQNAIPCKAMLIVVGLG